MSRSVFRAGVLCSLLSCLASRRIAFASAARSAALFSRAFSSTAAWRSLVAVLRRLAACLACCGVSVYAAPPAFVALGAAVCGASSLSSPWSSICSCRFAGVLRVGFAGCFRLVPERKDGSVFGGICKTRWPLVVWCV